MLTALLGGVLLVPWLLREPGAAPLLCVGVCAGAASLTRLAGVSFTLAAVVAVLLWMARPIGVRASVRRRCLRAGVGPVALWALVTRLVSPSGDVRPIGFHPPGWRQFDTCRRHRVRSGWSVSVPIGRCGSSLLSVIVVVCVVAGVLIANERPTPDADAAAKRSGDARQRANGCEPGIAFGDGPARSEQASEQDVRRLLGILALFVASYLLMVIVTNVFLDASTSLEGRLLVPVQVTGGVLVLGLVHRTLVSAPARGSWRSSSWCSWCGACGRPAPSCARSAASRRSPRRRQLPGPGAVAAGRGGGEAPARRAPGVERARQRVLRHRAWPSIFLPPKQYLVAGERNADFGAEADELGRIFSTRHGYVVLYADFSTALPSAADLGKHMQLVEVGRFRDGVLYRVERRA